MISVEEKVVVLRCDIYKARLIKYASAHTHAHIRTNTNGICILEITYAGNGVSGGTCVKSAR